jgi:type I restriction enzyme, S subunit
MREDWVECKFEDLLDYEQPTNYIIKEENYSDSFPIPVLTAGKGFIKGYTNEEFGVFDKLPTIIFDDFTTASQYVNFKFKVKSSAMKILNPTSSLVNLKFLFNVMQVCKVRSETHKRYWISEYSQIRFGLPPLPEQRAIVKKIEALFSSLDAGIADLKKAQEQLKIYRQAVLKKAFEGELTKEWREKQTELPTAQELLMQIEEQRQAYYENQIEDWKEAVVIWEKNGKEGKKPKKLAKSDLSKNDFIDSEVLPNSWKLVQISDILKFLTDYHANGGYETLRDNVELLDDEGYALMIRATNFEKNDFRKDVKFISEQAYNFLSKTKLYGGEILFGKIGNAGKSYLMPHLNRPCSLAMNLFSLTTYINNKYLSYHLKNNKQVHEINSYVKGVGNPTIDKKSIRSIHISLCPLQEQAQIVKEIESRLSVCDAVEQQIKDSLSQAEALRQSILKKAFEGRLLREDEVEACKQESDYEPAAVLLEKIKAEKETNKSSKKIIKGKSKKKMEKKEILQLLAENNNEMLVDQLWKNSVYAEDIDVFYLKLKELAEAGKISEEKNGKKVSIKLI